MKKWHIIKGSAVSFVLALCMSLTACGGGTTSVDQPPDSTSASSSTVSSVSVSDKETSEPIVSEENDETLPSQYTSDIKDTAESTVANATEDVASEEVSSVPNSGSTAEDNNSFPPTSETDPVESTPQSVVSTVPTSVTTPKTDPPAPVEVVIPDVKSVSAPGKEVADSGTAVIDYSNAEHGYIAASYNGASARAKLRIQCGGVTNDHDLAADGSTEYFPLVGSGDYTIGLYEQIEGKSYGIAAEAKFGVTISDDVGMYLYPNKYVKFDKRSDSVYKAAEITAGKSGTIEKLAAIFAYITDNVSYDYDLAATVKSGYVPDPDSVLKKRKGICFDYASLFAAMARSQGIPTRLVIGYASPEIYHSWNEVYTKETGWISAELLLDVKGYNLVDSTFYAGAADKAAMADYISNDANYSAVYRY